MVDRVTPTTRYVSVEGPVARTIPGTAELRREITERYLQPEQAQAYLKLAEAEFDPEIAVYLRPEHWLGADLGPA